MADDIQQNNAKADDSIASSTRASNAWTNPKKRPRSYDPATQLETTIDEDILRHADKAGDSHTPKRMRAEEWPLRNSDEAAESDRFSRQAHLNLPSSRHKKKSILSTRPSRFLEGSMNDKISQRPPSLYVRDEEAMEQYASANMEDVEMVYDAGIEPNKSSGMFRFGKAIANAFNSVNVWQGLNGIWKEKEKEDQAKPEKDALKAKAELKYAELKKSGYRGTQNAPPRPESQEIPAIKYEDTDESRRSSFRDSGVDVDGYRSSSERKDSDQSIIATESLMPPPALAAKRRSASPFSDASSGRRSSMHFRKPSLEGLKRVKSQIHLPSIKRHASEDTPPVPSFETDDVAGPGLRRELSKKDIAKQYKLSKKVSDLENKLEVARRELEFSIQEAPPVPDLPVRIGRKRFVPGALASLPSERLLMPQTQKEDSVASGGNRQAVNPVDAYNATTSTDDKGNRIREHDLKAQNENAEAVKQALWDKRASDIAAHNAAARLSKALRADTKIDDVLESEAAKSSVMKSKGGRPRKSQESKASGGHDASAVYERRPKIYTKTPRNSPMRNKDIVPPVPAKGTFFDPTKVDQAKIMAMRAIPDTHVPFGKAWDDMKNLRKEHPDATEVQLVTYVSSQSALNKVTDHTSVSHGDRPPSPFLSRPRSTSPMKTRARASNRGISPPPPSISSAKKFHKDLAAEKSPTGANPESAQAEDKADPSATKAPSMTHEKAPEAPRASPDKTLTDVKMDEFEWPDDVF